MNYTILAITALIMAIVAVAVVLRELWKSIDDIYLYRRNDDIGDEAWRLIMKKEYEKSTHKEA